METLTLSQAITMSRAEKQTITVSNSPPQVMKTIEHAEKLNAFRAAVERGRKAAAVIIDNATQVAPAPAQVIAAQGAGRLLRQDPAEGMKVATWTAPDAIRAAAPFSGPPQPSPIFERQQVIHYPAQRAVPGQRPKE